MKQAESLTRSAFLLAFDLRKNRLAQRGELGYLVRAAALSELLLAGCLADDSGKARAVTAPVRPGRLQTAVWEQIAGSPPRAWRHWIGKEHAKSFRLVRDELAAARLIRVEQRRILLLFPIQRIEPRMPYLSRRLAERVGQATHGGRPVERLDRDVRVLAALAAAARLRTVAGTPRRERKERIQRLSGPVEPIATALRKSIDAARSSYADGG
ncbi:GPP34 family phosphoprotein [Nonomuraea sp. NPDC050643]|uniref:GPP34 family phosphoprotein n=1 Tax=Nonomuraea sp. NPDC050643 TaxID=3155660 RepID=UPI0033D0BA77